MTRILIAAAALALTAGAADVTFNKDILPVLQDNCQTCHRPGEIGPMPLLTYEGVRPWAKSIKTAVVSRKMPPWFADPKYGHFANDHRLKDSDIDKIVAWVDSGAAEGDAKAKPAPRQWSDGWIVKPDVVFQMQKPYKVPVTGTIEYTYFVVPTGFTEDTWVIDGEVRPGDRSVVHHASVHVRPPGSQWMKDAKPGEPYVPPKPAGSAISTANITNTAGNPVNMSNEWFLGYVPGVHGEYFDKDHSAAKLIPAGSDLVFEIHYTANGKAPGVDQTKVGFVLAKTPPRKRLLTVPVADMSFTIPPGDANYGSHATATFDKPVELVYSQPHMHLRGKAMDINLVYPTGESETLVERSALRLQLAAHLLPGQAAADSQGTRVELDSHWDNSANNKYNPDPKATVRWGDQSWEEMNFAWIGVIADKDDTLDNVMRVRNGNAANASPR